MSIESTLTGNKQSHYNESEKGLVLWSIVNCVLFRKATVLCISFVHHISSFTKAFFPIDIGNVQDVRSFQLTRKSIALCSIHQFDGIGYFQVVHPFIDFGSGVGPMLTWSSWPLEETMESLEAA